MQPQQSTFSVDTAQLFAESGIEFCTQMLSFIYDFERFTRDVKAPEDVIWGFIEGFAPQFGLDDLVVYKLHRKRKELIQVAAFGAKNQGQRTVKEPLKIPVGSGIVGSVAAHGVSEIIDNTDLDTRYIPDDQIRGSELTVPIFFKDKLIGILDSESHKKSFFNEHHKLCFEIVSGILGKHLQDLCIDNQKSNQKLKTFFSLLDQDFLFLDPDLSLESVAQDLNITPEYLSGLLNSKYQMGFSEIINRYRLHHFIRLLSEEKNKSCSLLKLAFQSGFSSKSTFNRVFKKMNGCSPTTYLRLKTTDTVSFLENRTPLKAPVF